MYNYNCRQRPRIRHSDIVRRYGNKNKVEKSRKSDILLKNLIISLVILIAIFSYLNIK